MLVIMAVLAELEGAEVRASYIYNKEVMSVWFFNPFLLIKNKQLFISSEGFSAL